MKSLKLVVQLNIPAVGDDNADQEVQEQAVSLVRRASSFRVLAFHVEHAFPVLSAQLAKFEDEGFGLLSTFSSYNLARGKLVAKVQVSLHTDPLCLIVAFGRLCVSLTSKTSGSPFSQRFAVLCERVGIDFLRIGSQASGRRDACQDENRAGRHEEPIHYHSRCDDQGGLLFNRSRS